MSYLKYGNKNVTVDGIRFSSKREANRYLELKLLEKANQISNLELQKEFILIPNQHDKDNPKKLKERAVKYIADFYYYDKTLNKYICEDTKGFRTKEYVIKRKLMLYIHNISITEV